MAKMKRYMSIVLTLLVCIGLFTGYAEAAEAMPKAETKTDVNLRIQPTTINQPYYVEIPKKTSVDAFFRIKTEKGEFVVVSYEGNVGFIPARFMSIPDDVSTAKFVNVKTRVAVNFRVQPEKSNAKYYAEIPAKTLVEAFDITVSTSQGTFWLCRYNGKYGFIPTQYANQNETAGNGGAEKPSEPETETSKTITKVALDLRVDTFINRAKVVMEVPKKAEVTVVGKSFTSSDGYEITKVFYKGNFGYVKSKYLSGLNQVTPMTVKEETSPYNLGLRKIPAETRDVWCRIPENEKFYVLGEEAGYKLVAYNGFCGYIPARFGTATKTYNVLNAATTKGGTGNRSINIRLACGKLSGVTVNSGGKFSWFESHGRCLKENGYLPATVFTSNGTAQGIGGGVCQVASTINIVAKQSGINTYAAKHKYPVVYCNREDEATVEYPVQNFTFKNTIQQQIFLLLYQTQEGACTVVFLTT